MSLSTFKTVPSAVISVRLRQRLRYCDMTPSSSAQRYQGTCCRHLQGRRPLFYWRRKQHIRPKRWQHGPLAHGTITSKRGSTQQPCFTNVRHCPIRFYSNRLSTDSNSFYILFDFSRTFQPRRRRAVQRSNAITSSCKEQRSLNYESGINTLNEPDIQIPSNTVYHTVTKGHASFK